MFLVKRRRALTQQIMPSDVRAASRRKSTDDLDLIAKENQEKQAFNMQKKLQQQDRPQLEVSTESKKPYLKTPKLE